MKSERKPAAVVVGHDHQNTLGVIRSLGEAKYSVYAVLLTDDSDCSTAHSKYLERTFFAGIFELQTVLTRIGNMIGERVPLIPCGDDAVDAIARSQEQLEAQFVLPGVGNGAHLIRLMNKMEMLEAAKAAGLKVPRWICMRDGLFESAEVSCAQLRFPLMIKPVKLKAGGRFEFRVAENMEELDTALEYARKNCADIIIQEYIRKIAEFGVNGCRLSQSGETVFGGVIHKKRFSQSALGSTTAGIIGCDPGALCDAVRQLVEYVDYRGIFDVEFLFDGKDYYFVEINFRNGGYGYAYTRAGRNYPAMWAAEACGGDIASYISKPAKQVRFINESADLQNVRAGNETLFGWFWDVVTAGARMYLNARDMRPILRKVRGK